MGYLSYTSDAADELLWLDRGGCCLIKKETNLTHRIFQIKLQITSTRTSQTLPITRTTS